MALTHVKKWNNEIKNYLPITIEEAKREFPNATVQARSQIFMCGLCARPVTLTMSEVQERHFRHSNDERSRDCPDHSNTRYGASSSSAGLKPNAHGLPIKLFINGRSFSVAVGFVPIPHSMINETGKITISKTANDRTAVLIVNLFRMSDEKIVYAQLGEDLSSRYFIGINNVESPKLYRRYWPEVIDGIDPYGSLFDKETGKKLPIDADVQINKEYYLLIKHLDNLIYSKDIECREICQGYNTKSGYSVFIIKAKAINENTAKFFLSFRCRITDRPATLLPIWPMHTANSYMIHYKNPSMYFYAQGNEINAKIYPPCHERSESLGRYRTLYYYDLIGMHQVLSAGRNNVLKYWYFQESDLKNYVSSYSIEITDYRNNVLEGDIHETPPPNNILYVKVEYDGFVKIIREGVILNKIFLKGGTKTALNDIGFNMELQLFQGNDFVRSVKFKRKDLYGEDLLSIDELNRAAGPLIETPHQLRFIGEKLDLSDPVHAWMRKKIREGYISARAYNIILSYFRERTR